ncbi:MAG: VWA domain-containing protein, partial [Planctomycetota bacterium]|nr:VWA domain-containing protein [Planctomycetota bacterium]
MAIAKKPYSQELTRATPGCFLFLLDQSLSMEEPIGGSGPRKCDALADSINNWLQEMAIRASGDSGIRDYMEIA